MRHIESPLSDYAPDHDVPLSRYGVMMSAFALGFGAVVSKMTRRMPRQPALSDIWLLGAATHKLTRIITKDFITSPLRAPFTRRGELEGGGEVRDKPRGAGLQAALGELFSCPYCLGPWVATGLQSFLLVRPLEARFLIRTLVVVAISDFLHQSYATVNEKRRCLIAERKHFEGSQLSAPSEDRL